MRYYSIHIGDLRYQSLGAGGKANKGALQVELDLSVAAQGQAQGQNSCMATIWGIPMSHISQAHDLINKPVTIRGGMSKGLPLANPGEAGLLVKGKVFRCFGNWIGSDLNLNVIISASSETETGNKEANPPAKTTPIVMDWKKGKDLSDPLKQALQQAFPGKTVNMNIGQYMPPSDQPHFNGAIEQFASHINQYTKALMGSGPGVLMAFHGDQINVFDASSQQKGGKINYQDLIGQPTWIGPEMISIKLVMRGDLQVGQTIDLPKTLVTNTADGGHYTSGDSSPQSSLTFQGSFQIKTMRHVGNFRQPDAGAWVTIIEANIAS